MRQAVWWASVTAASLMCAGAILWAPRHEQPAAPAVQPCGENAGWIEVKPGQIVCTLKNGQVMNLRSDQ